MPKLSQMIVKYFVLDNNCLTHCFIPDQNFPFPDMQACSLSFTKKKGYMVNVYQNLSQTAVGNSKYLFFLLEMYEMYARIYDKKIPIIL